MIHDLDETLKQLLIQRGALDPSEVDISFDIPTRDWASGQAATRPTVNLYLYDLRENLKLREMSMEREGAGNGRAALRRRPLRIDVSYMVTCWTSAAEDQHRLLWTVLATFFRSSSLPEELLQGDLRRLQHPIRLEVAQPDGVLKNSSDFWGALENQLRPSISLVATLELDLQQVTISPLVFASVLKLAHAGTDVDGNASQALATGWQIAPLQVGGLVRTSTGQPVAGAAVRLLRTGTDGGAQQVGATVVTDPAGRYILRSVRPDRYTLVVEAPGSAPVQQPLTIAAAEPGQPPPEFIHEVEVLMAHA